MYEIVSGSHLRNLDSQFQQRFYNAEGACQPKVALGCSPGNSSLLFWFVRRDYFIFVVKVELKTIPLLSLMLRHQRDFQ
jgi:hypothetical protein